MENGYVKLEVNNKIGTIEFYHPKGNSLTSSLLSELETKIIEVDENEAIHVLVLKSKGDRVFCSGASFDELLEIKNLKQGKEFFMGFAKLINAIRKCSKLVIAQVEGKVVGGGVGIVAACDYTIAHTSVAVKLSEISIGIGPFVIEPAISHKIGKANTMFLSLNPKQWFSTYWCVEKQLFSEVLGDPKELQETVLAKAEEFSNYSLSAVKQLKEIYWEGAGNWDVLLKKRAAISGKEVLSDFTKEVLSKFKEQRDEALSNRNR